MILPDDKQLFSKPLITGASISADWASLSPGKRLAERFTNASDIRVIARGGQAATSVLSGVTPAVLMDRSIVVGFDLFFWDSSKRSIAPSLLALKNLITHTQAAKLPLVIGDIPELIPGHQPGRAELNKAIHHLCQNAKNCFVVPLNDLYQRISNDGYVEIKSRRYTLLELLPDGLHTGSVAGDYLADVLYRTLRP